MDSSGVDDASSLFQINPKKKTWAETFDELLPYYLSLGMSPDEYWHGDPWLVQVYLEAQKHKRQRESEAMWLNGLYIESAFGVVLARAFGDKNAAYLPEPINVIPKTEEQIREEQIREKERLIQRLSAYGGVPLTQDDISDELKE